MRIQWSALEKRNPPIRKEKPATYREAPSTYREALVIKGKGQGALEKRHPPIEKRHPPLEELVIKGKGQGINPYETKSGCIGRFECKGYCVLCCDAHGWNSHIHREYPKHLESANLSRDNLSTKIGRR